jgi:ribonuclease I
MPRRFSAFILTAFLGPLASLGAWALQPSQLSDFSEYTFAMSWHPGFCAAKNGAPECAYPAAGLTLHGLWASLPGRLKAEGMDTPQWWREGCDHVTGKVPEKNYCALAPVALSSEVRGRLEQVMPSTESCLERHEYVKHAVCFGFDEDAFFARSIALFDIVSQSSFGALLSAPARQEIDRDELTRAYASAFGTRDTRSLKLICEVHGERAWLSSVEIGIAKDQLDAFPAAASLTPLLPGNCPQRIQLR